MHLVEVARGLSVPALNHQFFSYNPVNASSVSSQIFSREMVRSDPLYDLANLVVAQPVVAPAYSLVILKYSAMELGGKLGARGHRGHEISLSRVHLLKSPSLNFV